MRLDVFLMQNHYFDSRQKAKEAIESGYIQVDDKIINKPSFEPDLQSHIQILHRTYVSRAGHKLKMFLEEINFKPRDFYALDVGAARGGFTQVLLEYGAKQVYCVDVGSNQLHPTLKPDSRIVSFEGCDIRDFAQNIAKKQNLIFDILVCDVSFIGIEKIFSALEHLSDTMILLFKPQFEVGRAVKRSKKGVLKDFLALRHSMCQFLDFLQDRGFHIVHTKASKLKGKEGNEEFFIFITRQ